MRNLRLGVLSLILAIPGCATGDGPRALKASFSAQVEDDHDPRSEPEWRQSVMRELAQRLKEDFSGQCRNLVLEHPAPSRPRPVARRLDDSPTW